MGMEGEGARRVLVATTRALSYAQTTQYFKGGWDRAESFAFVGHMVPRLAEPGGVVGEVMWDEAEAVTRMTPVSRGRMWARDALAIPHNGIRKELKGLYVLIGSMQRRESELTPREVEEFFAWFDEFEEFVSDYLRFEDRVLFPLLKSWEVTLTRPGMRCASRTEVRKDLAALLAGVAKCSTLPPRSMHMLRTLFRFALEIPPLLMNYFRYQETFLPGQIEKRADASRRAMLSSCFLEYIQTCANPKRTFFLTTRWIEEQGLARSLQETFNTETRPMLRMMVKKRMQREFRRILSTHILVVRKFYHAWVDYERRRGGAATPPRFDY